MPTLDATVGGASANSYATVADADTYFDERLNVTAWTDASADDKARALIVATRLLDAEDYEGTPVKPPTGTSSEPTQALKWPRHATAGDDEWTYLDTVIPDPLKRATYELALHLLVQGTTDVLADTGLEAFERVKVGPLEVVPRHVRKAAALPQVVYDLIADLLVSGRNSLRLVRA